MKAKPILEPEGVDLVIEGGEFSASDLKLLRAMIRKSKKATEEKRTAKRKPLPSSKTKRTNS